MILYYVINFIPLEEFFCWITSTFVGCECNKNMIIFNDFVINIISLCSGKLEIALLISFILATSEMRLTYRIVGSIIAIIFIIVFNFLRILITIYFISSFLK